MRAAALLAIALAGCGAIPEPDAEEACRSIFDAWQDAAVACGVVAHMPDRDAVCAHAHSVDREKLDGDCLPWIRSHTCSELQNELFQLHCANAVILRDW